MTQPRKFYRFLVGPEGGGRSIDINYEWFGEPRRRRLGPNRPPFFEGLRGGGAEVVGTGFPPDLATQTLLCDLDRQKPLRDFEENYPIWLVSNRAKQVLEQVAPGAVAFAPLNVRLKENGVERDGPPYWHADVVRCESAMDEARSQLNWTGAGKAHWYDPTGSTFVVRDDLAADAHLFRENKAPSLVFCSEQLADAVRQEKMTGLKIRPL